jgi:hypothetical protein
MDNNIPVSEMTVPQFYATCTRLLQQLSIDVSTIIQVDEKCMIEIPDTNPTELFVCDRTCWLIEKAEEGEESYIFDTINGPNDYKSVAELRRALDKTFNKLISMSKFNTSDIQLWMAIDKLTNAVHSHL